MKVRNIYNVLPRSLATVDGTLQKGNKSKWTQKLESRCQRHQLSFCSELDWVTIIDSMFIINTSPLRQHQTLEHYTDFLFRQYCVPDHILSVELVKFTWFLTVPGQNSRVQSA